MFEKLIYNPRFTVSEDPLAPRIHAHAHNTFLELLAETGMLGFLAYMYIFVFFFTSFFGSLKKRCDHFRTPILIGLAGGILASLILSLGTTIIIVDLQNAAMFWLFLGAGFGLFEKSDESRACV